MRHFTRLFILFFILIQHFAFAQTSVTKTPDASPKAAVMQTIGLTDIKVVYHRPAVKGRQVWGNMVPYNAVWRAGANDNTVISFSTDVKIEGKELKAGTYGLHMLPKENECEVIFSNNSTAWGSFSYNQAEDALRVTIQPQKTTQFYEWLAYEFEDPSANSTICALKWENKAFPFKIEANTPEIVAASLRAQLQNKAGFNWIGFNEAANYCLNNNVNLQEALTWATQSVGINPQPVNMLTKARLTGKINGAGDKAKELELTLTTLENDLKIFPVTWKEYLGAANYAQQNGNLDKALAWADESVKSHQAMSNMIAKSNILQAKGDTKGAETVKKQAIEKGTNAELNNYGYQLLFAGNMAGAIEIFEANTKKNPTDPNVWDSLGEGYFTAGEKDKAITAFKKSLSLNPPANVKANSMKFLAQLGVKADDIKP
ncbi:MAG: DUF2911 domain-containing protein [Saprospiraceae bacterium]|nr:DUF2911 domain-containing protein [Saprospiraceae bacterium]